MPRRGEHGLDGATLTGCTFCEIAEGTRSADLVWSDDLCVAFLDHRPLFPGHVLVIPRDHHETIEDLPDSLHASFLAAAARISAAVRRATGAQGTFVAMNNTVSQSVPHAHLHVVPRTKGDGLRGFFWPRNPYRDDSHRERVREAIREELGEGVGG